MNGWKRILSIILLLPFVFATTGVLVFHYHCSCTGEDKYSLYFSPSTCMSNGHNEDEPHIHEKGTINGFGSGNCILCSVSTSDCHCSEPTAKYLKLKNQVTEDDDKFVRVLSENIPTGIVTSDKAAAPDLNCSTSGDSEYQPPGFSMSCKEFLSFICQHKIPAVA